jgi:hypothetical protein
MSTHAKHSTFTQILAALILMMSFEVEICKTCVDEDHHDWTTPRKSSSPLEHISNSNFTTRDEQYGDPSKTPEQSRPKYYLWHVAPTAECIGILAFGSAAACPRASSSSKLLFEL